MCNLRREGRIIVGFTTFCFESTITGQSYKITGDISGPLALANLL